MKKLIYIMLAAVAIMTVACGGKTQTNEEKATEMCQKMLDAMKAGNEDSVSAIVKETYDLMTELQKTDTVAYKEYLAAFDKFNKEHAEEIENSATVKSFLKEKAANMSDSLKSDVKELSNDAKAAVDEKIDAEKKAVSDKVAEEKAAVKEKIDAEKKAISDQAAKDKAAAKEKINNILK